VRIAYFDAGSGISGDMTIGALLDAGAPKIDVAGLGRALGALGVAGYRLTYERVRVGARAHPSRSFWTYHHHHRDWRVSGLVETPGRGLAAGVIGGLRFQELAAAGAAVHGVPVETVHFQEVSAIDAIVGIVVHLPRRAIDAAIGPLPGEARLHYSDGRLPVPAPATVRLLEAFHWWWGTEKESS
jgi:uncharacterized protein (DUF111 family)